MVFKNTNKSGFTLIELLVVIAIIALLSSVIMTSLAMSRMKARDAKRTADIKNVKTALEMYYDVNSIYPVSADTLFDPFLKNKLVPDYIKAVPDDPVVGNDYRYYTNAPQFYVIKIRYEGKPECYVCGGDYRCSPGSRFWSLYMCN